MGFTGKGAPHLKHKTYSGDTETDLQADLPNAIAVWGISTTLGISDLYYSGTDNAHVVRTTAFGTLAMAAMSWPIPIVSADAAGVDRPLLFKNDTASTGRTTVFYEEVS